MIHGNLKYHYHNHLLTQSCYHSEYKQHQVWQTINELYVFLGSSEAERMYEEDRDALFARIQRSTQLCLGLVRGTMLHDTPLAFIWLGVVLERMSQRARLLDVEHHEPVAAGAPHPVPAAAPGPGGGPACRPRGGRGRRGPPADGPRLAACVRTRAQLLTPRELEVLSYLAKGLAKKEIARVTDLSVKTVEQHCTHLMQKLDIHDRVELARFAIREGLVQP